MARMTKHVREQVDAIKKAGGEVVNIRTTGSNHTQFVVKLPDGGERKLTAALTTSDHRSLKNLAAIVKRWVAGLDTPALCA